MIHWLRQRNWRKSRRALIAMSVLFILLFACGALALNAQTTNPGTAARQLFPGLNVINQSFTLSPAISPLYVNVSFPPDATSAGVIVNGALPPSSGSGGSTVPFTAGPSATTSVTQSGALCTWAGFGSGGTLTNGTQVKGDGRSVTCGFGASTSNTLLLEGFGFAIPANAVITGVTADINVLFVGGVNNNSLPTVELLKAGVASGTNKGSGAFVCPQGDSNCGIDYFYGGSSDLWGNTLAPTDINAAGFGIEIIAGSATSAGSINLDYVSLTISYTVTTPPTGGTAGTGFSYSALQLVPFLTQPLECVIDIAATIQRCPIPLTGQAQIQLTTAPSTTQQLSLYVFVFTGSDILQPIFTFESQVQFGMNAIFLPGGVGTGTTALSTIIDTRGVHQLTLLEVCTQTVQVNVVFYAEDGATPITAPLALTSGAFSTAGFIHISSEQSPSSNQTIGQPWLEFPQRALAFSFTNQTAIAGTCTGRVFLAY